MEKKVFINIDKNRNTSAIINLPLSKGCFSGFVFVIAHGSSNDKNHELIKGVSEIYSLNGAKTIRFNFLFREENKFSGDIKKDNSLTYLKVFEYAKSRLASKNDFVFACGKSLGAKVGAELISSKLIFPHGFISFGYPLHSKSCFLNLKLDPLKNIFVPSIFFTGEFDPLCKKELLSRGLAELKINSKIYLIKNADHGLGIDKKYTSSIFKEIYKASLEWINSWIIKKQI
ncbi:MAG: hypothetical protein RBR53_09070 [Desulforegulaceae bacterium]|nr:hypothetical protein [Desulforegulaceae bacterium]